MSDNNKADKKAAVKKKSYKRPTIKSEELIAFGALCNGTAGGGRKSSTGAPNFCNASKLLS